MVLSPSPINVSLGSYLTVGLSAISDPRVEYMLQRFPEVAQLCTNISIELCDQISEVKCSLVAKN